MAASKYLMVLARVRFEFLPLAGMGTEYAVTTGRFEEAKFRWPLFGNESWKATVASAPSTD